MTKPAKRFFTWTSLAFAAGLCAGGGLKATLDALATRHGWHVGGEIFALGALIALPLVWLWGVKLGYRMAPAVITPRVQDALKRAIMGGWLSWK
jgi:hypothetical protein